jgi:hypothetical protein
VNPCLKELKMRRRALTTMVVLPFFVGLMAATSLTALAGAGPFASGGSHLTVHDVFGLDTLVLQEFGFTATLTSGGSASGWFQYRDVEDGVPFTAGGSVTCLTVIGTDAWIGATISLSNDPTLIGLGGWWHVTDNGQGTGSPADITTFLGVGSLEATAAFCADHPAYRFPFPIDGGDIQVYG